MDGEGTLISAQGDKYKGQFRDGQKHGFGIEILADGSRYEGSFVNGERDGAFVEYDRNGNKTAEGVYTNGRRQANNR